MAKRRSKIKLGGKTPLRDTRSRGPSKRPVLSRKLTRQLDLNSVKPCDETCPDGIHEDGVESSDVINTETATAELRDEQLTENGPSSEEDGEKPTKMKKSPTVKGRAVQPDKTPSTCPREIDGEMCLDVECGNNTAVLYLSKLCVGSKGVCIEHDGSWLTPNEFQFVSGRESAKDWKRSIRHNGFSLKLLIVNGCVELHAAPSPAPQTAAAATPTTTTNNNSSKSSISSSSSNKTEKVAKPEKKETPDPLDNKRRYIPVKRRNGIVKDKVGGKRKKIRRSKKVLGNRGVAKPTSECPKPESPDVTDGNKENVDTTPCPSKDTEPEVDDVKKLPVEEEKEEQGSEEFFRTLELSKTPSNSSSPSPVSEDIPEIVDTSFTTEADQNDSAAKETRSAVEEESNGGQGETDVQPENADDATPKVVETFCSRLIPDDTGLRIAINRQIVCMKDDIQNDNEVKNEIVSDEIVSDEIGEVKIEKPNLETENVDLPVTEIVEEKTKQCNVKTETVTTEESKNEMDAKDDSLGDTTVDKITVEATRSSVLKCGRSEDEILNKKSMIGPCEIVINDVKSKDNSKDVLKQIIDCKCDENEDKRISKATETFSENINKACMRTYTATSSSELVNTSALLQKNCYKHATTMVPCNCTVNSVKDKPVKDVKLSKPVTAESLKCHRKSHEPRTTATKTLSESTFQEKTQYENEMMELMSIYRPVMVPCDGRCPYVCSDTTSLRNSTDTPSPYAACQNSKWPATSPFLSGVMTPEMMYYMTQQLYLDMYNSSLYAQCSDTGDKQSQPNGEKHSQPKPVKRKAPEHDPDLPLDLTVKRAKVDNDKPKALHTQDTDSPIDFSKKSSYGFEKKVSSASKPAYATHNGSFKSNGYRAKPNSHHSGSSMCTCGKKDDIRTWNVEKVCSFLKQYHDCAIYTKTFREQGIDGRLLPYLTMQHLTRTLGMQTGPAITFLDAVDQQIRGNALRHCQWCKG